VAAISWYPYYCGGAGPHKFLADVQEQICEIALSPPRQLVGMAVCSLAKLQEYLVEQKIVLNISLEQLRQILRHSNCLSFRSPPFSFGQIGRNQPGSVGRPDWLLRFTHYQGISVQPGV